MNPQPFYTSKTFWTMIIGIVFQVLVFFGVVKTDANIQMLTDSILFILGMIFRWQANQTLALPGPDVKKLS